MIPDDVASSHPQWDSLLAEAFFILPLGLDPFPFPEPKTLN
jgi:hypothetical protein